MRKVYLLLLLIVGSFTTLAAQDIVRSLEERVPGQGVVVIHQDPSIAALIGTEHAVGESGERKVIQTNGYRVQVYAGPNSRVARNEAEQMADKVKEYFPQLHVYTSFVSPRWLCRVGDFRSIEEADAMMRQLRATGVFKEVIIVKDQVSIHL